jgi:hypothetical protein
MALVFAAVIGSWSAAFAEVTADPQSPKFFSEGSLLERSMDRLKAQHADFEIRQKPSGDGDRKGVALEVMRGETSLLHWEGDRQSCFLFRDGALYYANCPSLEDAPMEIRKYSIASGEDSQVEIIPCWIGKNKAYHQALWMTVEEGALISYRYSSTHGIAVKRLAGQGLESGPSLQAGCRRWLALCPPALKEALKPLVEWRRRHGVEAELLEVTTENLPQVRERVEAMKRQPRFCDCLLLAGALDQGAGARPDCVLDFSKGSRGRMSGRIADSVLGLDRDSGLPLLAVGRLPAGSPDELSEMVARIIAAEKGNEAGSGQLAFVTGNPMPGNEQSKLANGFLNSQFESLRARLDPAWQLSGVADVTGNPFASAHEAFHSRVGEVLASPWEVLAVFGHSNAQGLWSGDDCSMTPKDWSALPEQKQHRLFFTCGCHAIQNQSAYAVAAVRAKGGSLASIGASGESWSAIGYLAGGGLTDCLCGQAPETLGEWWLKIQQGIAWGPVSPLKFVAFDQIDGTHGKTPLKDQRLEHLEMWSLLGDPGMSMPPPK